MKARGFITPQIAMLIGVVAVMASLTIWALWERSGRLSCEVDRTAITAAYNVLADKVKQQNTAVIDLGKRGAAARKVGAEAIAKAEARNKEHEAEIALLRLAAAAPTPQGATCATAWTMIREAVKGVAK